MFSFLFFVVGFFFLFFMHVVSTNVSEHQPPWLKTPAVYSPELWPAGVSMLLSATTLAATDQAKHIQLTVESMRHDKHEMLSKLNFCFQVMELTTLRRVLLLIHQIAFTVQADT